MPASKEVTTKVREIESVPSSTPLQSSAPVVPWWEIDGITSPADLYRAFAFTAVEQALKDRGECADIALFELVFEYVEIAVAVVLKAAGIPESWRTQYDDVVASLSENILR